MKSAQITPFIWLPKYYLRHKLLSIYDVLHLVEDDDITYKLIMVLSSLEPLKVNIIMVLAHIAPQQVTGTELTKLLGYSNKARTIYRGVLDELEGMDLIKLNKENNTYSISANRNHPLVHYLTNLALEHGQQYTEQLWKLLGD